SASHPVSEATFPAYQTGIFPATATFSNSEEEQEVRQAQDRYSTPTTPARSTHRPEGHFARQHRRADLQ
ncbi:hypothetical protein, partial [Gordonia sihwensis]|uniref:hypothetical protein n=1 Tax=Gordonia sihwensis TaxID=173559 RepID=UPI001C3F401B